MNSSINFLSYDDLIVIHHRVRRMALEKGDTILMIGDGVKNRNLLESAVARQHAGSGGVLAYDEPLANAATLMFGVTKNHGFHDANKRTAVVAMLNHLDRNKLLVTARWEELERVVLDLEQYKLHENPKLRHAPARRGLNARRTAKAIQLGQRPDQQQIIALREWLRQNTRAIERGDSNKMSYDDLGKLLESHGFFFGDKAGNTVRIMKRRLGSIWPFRSKEIHVDTIPYPGGKRIVDIETLKRVRRKCELTEEDGADNQTFYNFEERLDQQVNKWRQLLRSLADK